MILVAGCVCTASQHRDRRRWTSWSVLRAEPAGRFAAIETRSEFSIADTSSDVTSAAPSPGSKSNRLAMPQRRGVRNEEGIHLPHPVRPWRAINTNLFVLGLCTGALAAGTAIVVIVGISWPAAYSEPEA
eukprot:6141408-Prymnesium_polylepis.1